MTAVLTRNWEARPEPYKGIQMRSKLERHTAEFLDEMGVQWDYEQEVFLHGRKLAYLPDFVIRKDYPELGLVDPASPFDGCSFIEVKPQEFIYALRDHLCVPERTECHVQITAEAIASASIEELWKPKRLAELLNVQVLVCGAVNRDRTLSVRMTPRQVVFETTHPLVNHRGVVKEIERQRRYEEQRRRWQVIEAEREAERKRRLADRLETFGRLVRNAHRITSRYDGRCEWCGNRFEGVHLYAFKATERWVTVCRSCTSAIESET